jgi:hypothetical protein
MKHYKIYKLERLEKRLNQQNHIEQNIFCSVKTIEHHGFRHCSAKAAKVQAEQFLTQTRFMWVLAFKH